MVYHNENIEIKNPDKSLKTWAAYLLNIVNKLKKIINIILNL